MTFFSNLEKKSKFHMETHLAKALLSRKNIPRGIPLLDLKLYYRSTVIKTVRCQQHKNSYVNQQGLIKDP